MLKAFAIKLQSFFQFHKPNLLIVDHEERF